MKRLLLLTLLGCIALCSHAWLFDIPYDRNFNTRSSEFTRHTVVPADSSLATDFFGEKMSAMDYAEIYITVAPDTNFSNQAFAHIIGYGPSPRLKSLDKNSTERQKLIIADDAFYELRKFEGTRFDDAYEYDYANLSIAPQREDGRRRIVNVDAIADYVTFDFDLSEYACDFDIYFILLRTDVIFDNAFSNFKFSDNIKSVNLYFGRGGEIGHDAFTAIRNIENVDVRLMTMWSWVWPNGPCLWHESSENIHVYSDSFTQETYNEALVPTFASESKINDLQTNPTTWNYSNNIYRFFKKWHTGVENVVIDIAMPHITLNSNILTIQGAKPGQIVEIFNIEGCKIGQFEIDSMESASYTINHSGVILVKVGQTVSKLILKS